MLHRTPNCNGGVQRMRYSIKFKYWAVSSTEYSIPTDYFVDLRWRAVWLHLIRKISYAEIAHTLFLSERSVQRNVELYQSSGVVEPRKQKHGPEQLLSEFEQITALQSQIDRPGIFLIELQQQLNEVTGRTVHISTICRTVHRLGFTRKRLQHIALHLVMRKVLNLWRRYQFLAPIHCYGLMKQALDVETQSGYMATVWG